MQPDIQSSLEAFGAWLASWQFFMLSLGHPTQQVRESEQLGAKATVSRDSPSFMWSCCVTCPSCDALTPVPLGCELWGLRLATTVQTISSILPLMPSALSYSHVRLRSRECCHLGIYLYIFSIIMPPFMAGEATPTWLTIYKIQHKNIFHQP